MRGVAETGMQKSHASIQVPIGQPAHYHAVHSPTLGRITAKAFGDRVEKYFFWFVTKSKSMIVFLSRWR
jgi:hypothetical protein